VAEGGISFRPAGGRETDSCRGREKEKGWLVVRGEEVDGTVVLSASPTELYFVLHGHTGRRASSGQVARVAASSSPIEVAE
jgi:hypothetical protein